MNEYVGESVRLSAQYDVLEYDERLKEYMIRNPLNGRVYAVDRRTFERDYEIVRGDETID